MRNRLGCVVLVPLLLAVLSPAASASTTDDRRAGYRYRTIDHPGFKTTSAVNGINDRGDFILVWDDQSGNFHSELGSTLQPGFTPLDPPGAVSTYGVTVTNRRLVAGTYVDAAGAQHGFTWSGGVFRTVDVPGAVVTQAPFEFGPGLGTSAYGVNERGVVAGQYSDAAGVGHGFLADGGSVTTFDAPGAAAVPGFFGGTQILRINDARQIAGNYGAGPELADHHPFFIQSGGRFTTIPSPPGSEFGQALGLSSNGVVTGFFTTDPTGSFGTGFTYRNGKVTLLPQVPAATGGFSTVADTNAPGVLVGEYFDATGLQHGYIAVPRT